MKYSTMLTMDNKLWGRGEVHYLFIGTILILPWGTGEPCKLPDYYLGCSLYSN